MPILEFENLPSKKTPIPAEVLEALQKNLLEMVFPVGSIYWNADANVDPVKELGFGEWKLEEGVVFVGASRTDSDFYLGVKGGEKKHVMTESEMYRHGHKQQVVADGGSENVRRDWSGDGNGRLISQEVYTENVGGSQPFNVCQPYDVSGYAWVRIA